MVKSSIIKYWDNVRRLTIRLLDLFPEGQFEFRPTDNIRTVAQLFEHILDVEIFVRQGIKDGSWIPSKNFALSDCLPDKMKAIIREALIREHEITDKMLNDFPEGWFIKIYQTPFGKISGEGIIYVAIDEEIHHRGNLYTYLRLLGIEPPQMVHNYGELFMEDKDGL